MDVAQKLPCGRGGQRRACSVCRDQTYEVVLWSSRRRRCLFADVLPTLDRQANYRGSDVKLRLWPDQFETKRRRHFDASLLAGMKSEHVTPTRRTAINWAANNSLTLLLKHKDPTTFLSEQ